MKKWIGLVLWFWAGLWICSGPAVAEEYPAEDSRSVPVGHITHVEGQLLRYVPEEQDWVATVQDAPFGLDDALFTTGGSRAEIRLPNRILIRLNERAQIQLIALEEEYNEIDLYSGTARFFHQGSGTMKVYTPFGYVLASPGAVFDLHSGEKITEVQAFQGELEFRPAGSQSRYRVEPGRSTLIADGKQVFSGRPAADPSWQSWNSARDRALARYRAYPGDSARYLPPELDYQAPVLDENGRWEQVPYQGEVYYFWRPVHVVSGWAPFTVGRWTVWYDDPCWIPAEPFGYITHHYGNWFFIRGYWYWAPPVRVHVRPLPLFYIPWAWYPGRVAWIHHGTTVAWIPLAPHEPYYCRRYWGPRVVVVRDPRAVTVHIGRYQHARHAVAVHRHNVFAVPNYQPFLLPPLKREVIVKDFQPLPILDQPFLTGTDPLRRKHHFTTAVIREKPRPASLDRIRFNQTRSQEAERTRRAPQPPPASQPSARIRPETGPGARPPVTATPDQSPARKKDLPDRFRTPPPADPAGMEGPAPEFRQRTGPGDGRPDTRGRPGTPPARPAIQEPQPRQRIETPAPRELPRDRGPGDGRPVTRGRPETPPARPAIQEPQPRQRIETPAPREIPRDRGPGDGRPATRGRPETPAAGPVIREQPVQERGDKPERTRDTGPGTDSSGKNAPRGKEKSGEDGRGPKER